MDLLISSVTIFRGKALGSSFLHEILISVGKVGVIAPHQTVTEGRMLPKGGLVFKGRNVVTGICCTREECCHRDQLYRGGMLSQRSVVQGRNVVTGISCTGEECCQRGW
jgi:hypothetical protein